jgi:hypothetical protein
MDQLRTLMEEAEHLATTDLERQRVESWRRGVWEYMRRGRQEFLEASNSPNSSE